MYPEKGRQVIALINICCYKLFLLLDELCPKEFYNKSFFCFSLFCSYSNISLTESVILNPSALVPLLKVGTISQLMLYTINALS
jgi:hypothetical protein